MSSVIIRMEANQVTLQDPKKQLFPHRQNSVDFAAGKRRMEEKSNLHILFAEADLLSQHLWEKHKMIIVNPYQISILNIFCHRSGE